MVGGGAAEVRRHVLHRKDCVPASGPDSLPGLFLGVVDDLEVLEAVGFPGADRVLAESLAASAGAGFLLVHVPVNSLPGGAGWRLRLTVAVVSRVVLIKVFLLAAALCRRF